MTDPILFNWRLYMKKVYAIFIAAALAGMCLLAGCSNTSASASVLAQTTALSNGTITLSGSGASVSGSGASADGSTVTVTSPGTYTVTGTLDDGQINVEANGSVTLVLSGASITNTSDDAIHIKSGTVTIELADGTENTVTSGTSAAAAEASSDTEDASGAAIYSKDAVTISGSGTLTVNGFINNGIAGKTGVTISSGTITVNSANDGIKSADAAVNITGGKLTIISGGDGISAETDLNITGGTFDITSGDGSEASNAGGMQMPGDTASASAVTTASAAADATSSATTSGASMQRGMKGGQMPGQGTSGGTTTQQGQMPSFGGSQNTQTSDSSDSDTSMKGLKAGGSLTISGGTFTINSTGHAIHSAGTIDITGGTFTISSSAGKGISGHGNVTIDGESTSITVAKSTEGIESKAIMTINNGTINITSSDDGLNAGGGSSGFGAAQSSGSASDHQIIINGGTITIIASGDGIDSTRDLTVNGGSIIVYGPTDSGNGALDSGAESGGAISVNGGTIIALGSSGMAEGFDTSSTQYSFLYNFSSSISAGTEITVKDDSGNVIYSCTAAKTCSSVEFSSSQLQQGASYTITAGSQTATVTMSSIAVNSASTMGGGMGQGGMHGGFGQSSANTAA